ncbi:EAL domain-containing protein [Demequina aurantiaca]|uniref:EAL domain-containing protein n=1 Tax=Demequina aurantiaca TaxID=676200 RepID=UPI003D334D0D
MIEPKTVLVLTPSLGGDFFGEILAGIEREIAGVGGRLVIVETLVAGAPRDEVGAPGVFATRAAWARVDGVVAITSAVGANYLQRLRDAGKPVALISNAQMPGFEAPIARPDNRAGTIAAVEHLIGHGHTRIGFVGNLAQPDIRDRFDAYEQTLAAHGLKGDRPLLYSASQNAETGGAYAARAVLSAAHRPTALMVATDRNAIGLMQALAAAGLEVPRDIAIVAFDNIGAGTFSAPALSSVDQRFDEVGALAGRLVLAQMRGEDVPHVAYRTDPAALIVRESCGCDIDAQHSESARGDLTAEEATQALRDATQDLLQRELLTGDDAVDGRLQDDAMATVDGALHLIELGDDVTAAQVQSVMDAFRGLTSRPDTLRRLTDAMANYNQSSAMSEAPTAEATLRVSGRVAAALWKAQAGAFLHRAEAGDAAIAEQYAVDAGLLDTAGSDPRDLNWLAGTHVKSAALGIWEDGEPGGRLEIVGTHGTSAGLPETVGQVLAAEDFPPEALIAGALAGSGVAASGREVCVVVPVSTRDRDWGLLALVAEIDPTTARETYQHWAALLSASLESQRLQEEVRRSALFDALTGLPNRELFVAQLEHALASCERSGTPFAVLFIDLDGFKLVNDSLGHQMGDRVLKAVGTDLTGQLRAVDIAARFGGDEFVILLADTGQEDAVVAAHRVQAALGQVHDFDGHQMVLRASIGVATSAFAYASAEDVLRDADTAMYRAKSAGPGSVELFDTPMHERSQQKESLKQEIYQGLQNGQFEVHYQPIVNLASGRTDRFEALVRWRHPERGLLMPAEFVSFMEDTAIIFQFGHWVLDEVCRQLVEWGQAVTSVSINVSGKEFWSQDLLRHILATLRRFDLETDRLTLEITESVLMRNPEMARRLTREMRQSGLRVHIDDFGTGYSSLKTLHQFPMDAFKIDRSFIQQLTRDDDSAELISSLVTLGKALGLSVVAEGVETDEQLALLQELGCATAQGYLFMPAVTGARATELLGRTVRDEGPQTVS